MTFQQFIDKYEGKKVDWDGKYQAQCVDLARQYINDVWKTPQFRPVVGAKNIWEAVDEKYYIKIPNTPTGVPENGDILIWDATPGNQWGHVAMFIDGGSMRMRVFEQDGFTQDGAKKAYRNYTNIKGWFRPKENMSDCLINNDAEGKKTFEGLVYKATQWDETVKYIWKDKDPQQTPASEVTGHIQGLKGRITTLERELGECKAKSEGSEGTIKQLKVEIANLTEDVKILNTRLNESKSSHKECIEANRLLVIKVAQLEQRIITITEECQQGELSITVGEFFKLLWNQSITIKK